MHSAFDRLDHNYSDSAQGIYEGKPSVLQCPDKPGAAELCFQGPQKGELEKVDLGIRSRIWYHIRYQIQY